MACGQLCAQNFEGKACLRPIDEICPMTNIASQGKPQTNADRIRAMSDEELGDFLSEYRFCDICEEECNHCTYHGDCDKRILDWLKQPSGVDHG